MTIGPIISLSLPKSGTTTLAVSLREAGLKVADWRIRRNQTDDQALKGQHLAPIIYEDYFASGDPLARLGEFQAITEMNAVNKRVSLWPQTDFALISAIIAHHPNARFVLSQRDPEAVANSMIGWNSLGTKRLPNNDVPGLPRPFGTEKEHLIKWIKGHYAFCHHIFRGSDNFLAYDLKHADVRDTISTFLGIELTWWGKANTTEDWNKNQRKEA